MAARRKRARIVDPTTIPTVEDGDEEEVEVEVVELREEESDDGGRDSISARDH